jgi:hypothetical protein
VLKRGVWEAALRGMVMALVLAGVTGLPEHLDALCAQRPNDTVKETQKRSKRLSGRRNAR